MQKVFLVDDSPLILRRVQALLAGLPEIELVGQAGSVGAAIQGILAARPDVVLLDLGLGKGSGFEVLGAVHARHPGIDFYVLSNFSSGPYRRHAARLGAKGFFDKTSDFERVRDMIACRPEPAQVH